MLVFFVVISCIDDLNCFLLFHHFIFCVVPNPSLLFADISRQGNHVNTPHWTRSNTPPLPSNNRKVYVLYVCVFYTSPDTQRMYSLLYSPKLLLSGCFRRDSASCQQPLTVFSVSSHPCWPLRYFTIYICSDIWIHATQKKWLFR